MASSAQRTTTEASPISIDKPARGSRPSRAVGVAAVAFVIVASACGPTPRAGGFDSDVPGARVDAIERVVDDWRSTRQLPDVSDRMNLVECLHSDDALVRFAAIGALKEMTGETRGYSYDASLPERRVEAERWASWAVDPTMETGPTTELGRGGAGISSAEEPIR